MLCYLTVGVATAKPYDACSVYYKCFKLSHNLLIELWDFTFTSEINDGGKHNFIDSLKTMIEGALSEGDLISKHLFKTKL